MIGYIFSYLVFFYSMAIMASYLWLVWQSYRVQGRLAAEDPGDDFIKYKLDNSPLTPAVTVIAPAYNEEAYIKENVDSLLQLDYPNYEIIIVNDGSPDHTLDILKREYQLKEIPYKPEYKVPCTEIRGVYRSTIHSKLTVVDKVNGGRKADSSNAGINLCRTKYFICTDADCYIEKKALYRMMWPVMNSHEPMIGVSGTMLMSNDCDIPEVRKSVEATDKRKWEAALEGHEPKGKKDKRADPPTSKYEEELDQLAYEKENDGMWKKLWNHIVKFFSALTEPLSGWRESLVWNYKTYVNTHNWPKPVLRFFTFLPVFQQLEYLRSFLIGKLGWSSINSLPNISGGFGLFDTEVAIKSGGYDRKSMAEDVDMLLRMVTYMCNQGLPYRVAQVPRVCCWTKGPEHLKGIFNQRARWARGLCEIVVNHFEMFFQRQYGQLGMFTLPYIFTFEFLACIIEFGGLYWFLFVLLPNDAYNHDTIWIILGMVYIFSMLMTFFLMFFDYRLEAVNWRRRWVRYLKFFVTSVFEPLYHVVIMHISIWGYLQYLRNTGLEWKTIER